MTKGALGKLPELSAVPPPEWLKMPYSPDFNLDNEMSTRIAQCKNISYPTLKEAQKHESNKLVQILALRHVQFWNCPYKIGDTAGISVQ